MIKIIKSLILNNKFKVVAISGYLVLLSTIFYFQYQKDNLRENITEITSEKVSLEVFYRAEIERITTKHNQIIQDMVNDESLKRLENEVERLKNQQRFQIEQNEKLQKELSELNNIEYEQCLDSEITDELKKRLK